MTRPTSAANAIRSSLVVSAASIVSGVLNAAALVLSARQGQITEIASYTVVTAALVLVSIAMAGGSTLLYVSGTEEQRRAVRSQRVYFVLPSMAVGVILIGAFYTHRGYDWPPILASGLVVLGNNFAELQYGDLARQMRFLPSAAVNCGSKLPALALVAVGAPLTVALGVAVVVQSLAAAALLRRPWFSHGSSTRLSLREAASAFRVSRQLHVYSLAELYSGRAASVGLSLFATPKVMACFGTVVSIYQAFGTVLYAGLQVPMAAKARKRFGIGGSGGRSGEVEAFAVTGAAGLAICVMVAASWITGEVLHLPLAASSDWLRILAVALPFSIVNRAVMLNLIGDGHYRSATKIAVLIAALVTLALALSVSILGPLGGAVATLFAESVSVGTLAVVLLRRRTAALAGKEM